MWEYQEFLVYFTIEVGMWYLASFMLVVTDLSSAEYMANGNQKHYKKEKNLELLYALFTIYILISLVKPWA